LKQQTQLASITLTSRLEDKHDGMKSPRVTHSFIVRVEVAEGGKRIVVQDLKTKERLEFDSWQALSRHLHIRTSLAETTR
jgi:hypothetical protein